MYLVRNPTVAGADALGAPRASTKPTLLAFGLASQESIAMMGNNLALNHIYADARRHDLLREAEHDRRLRQAERRIRRLAAVAGFVAAVRSAAGVALVRAGERLQGVGGANPADAVPSVATLRLAR
jgi:hypothetical protein